MSLTFKPLLAATAAALAIAGSASAATVTMTATADLSLANITSTSIEAGDYFSQADALPLTTPVDVAVGDTFVVDIDFLGDQTLTITDLSVAWPLVITTNYGQPSSIDMTGTLELLALNGSVVASASKSDSNSAIHIAQFFSGADFGNPALSGYTGSAVSYPWGSFGPSISPEALSNFLSGVNLANYVNEEESRINDFTMHEDINAAYVQNTFNSGLWRVLVGMRYEGTDFRAQGTGLDNGTFNNLETQRKYHHWLPALHVRRDLDGDTTVRSALTHSVVRPTFGQLAPGYVIDGTEASFGNPDLQAMKSRNLDLGIEQRLGHASVLSAYAFFKDINHFVYNTDLAGSGAWATFDQANTYANGDNAKVKGIELSYAQSFRQLPAPWNGLLLASNATFSDSKARIAGYSNAVAVSRDIPLPSQSDRTLNFMVGYEAGPWSTRLAANYKSRYLLEVTNVGSADGDLYVEAQTFYDLSARYNFSKQVQLVFEALNLGDETYHVYTGRPGLNAQHELYGRTFRVALKFAAF